MRKIVSFFGTKNEIFIDLNKRAAAYASQKGFDYEWVPQQPYDKKDVIAHLKRSDAGIIDIEPYGEEIFSQIKDSTRLLVRFGVGYDKVDLAAASRNGIAVARTTGANTLGVAEMAFTLMLALRRQLNENQVCVKSNNWDERTVCNETIGGTIGIMGFGAIGQAFAKLAKGLGCRLVAYDPFSNKETAQKAGVELVGLDELFQTADAITVHVPYSKETHHLVNAELLAKMKPTAVLVNTARGNIVDEDALYDALAAHKIRGAALDVYAQEPLPLTSPLLKLDNIILTPHVSSQTIESLWRIYSMAIDIASDFFEGKKVKHILNPDYNQQEKQ